MNHQTLNLKTLLAFVVIIFVFYFILIVPEKKRVRHEIRQIKIEYALSSLTFQQKIQDRWSCLMEKELIDSLELTLTAAFPDVVFPSFPDPISIQKKFPVGREISTNILFGAH